MQETNLDREFAKGGAFKSYLQMEYSDSRQSYCFLNAFINILARESR